MARMNTNNQVQISSFVRIRAIRGFSTPGCEPTN
jgi:hypothetical protein